MVDPEDVALFFRGVDAGLVDLRPDGRFNTVDRPTAAGRKGLLSRSRRGVGSAPSICRSWPPMPRRFSTWAIHESVLIELLAQSLQLDN